MTLLYGVGVNDADYKTRTTIAEKEVCCPFYRTWRNMFMRAYCNKYQIKHPTYEGCHVDERWHSFMSFKSWMEKEKWQGNQLDKDILFEGNKVYSPETCVFVKDSINKFIIDRGASRGSLKIGVCYDKERNKFISNIGDGFGSTKFLGRFETEDEAHAAWVVAKYKAAKNLVKLIDREDVRDAIVSRYIRFIKNLEPNLRQFIPKHLRK